MKLRPFELERYLANYEFRVRHLLCTSDCESVSVEEILALEPDADRRLRELRLGYSESHGSPKLRLEISSIYSTITPEKVLVHAGAEEAIFLFMNAVLNSGDEVIVHSPCYQALREIPRAIGAKVIPWEARAENSWSLDLAELRKLISPKTKALILNFPHNPTGSLMHSEHFREALAIADDAKILVFSDEVYRESEHSNSDRLPAACDLSAHAISLGVMSKTYGLAGLRIGWIATQNTPVLEKMAELKDYTTICNSAPSELLAEIALRHRSKLIKRNLSIIKMNLGLLDEFFAEYQELFSWQRPRAGSIAFPALKSGNASNFCQEVIAKGQVLLLPGSVFGNYESHFRVGFGRKDMPSALAALKGAMPQLARI